MWILLVTPSLADPASDFYVLEKVNCSDWAAPIVMVPKAKANGGIRINESYVLKVDQ